MISDEDLRVALARVQLGRIDADDLVALAFALLAEERYTAAIGELATLPPRASIDDVGPLFQRAIAELGIAAVSDADARELALLVPARRIAAAIADGTRHPLEGANALTDLYLLFDYEADELFPFWSIHIALEDDGSSIPELEDAARAAARALLHK